MDPVLIVYLPAPFVLFVTTRLIWNTHTTACQRYEGGIHAGASLAMGFALALATPIVFPVLVALWLTNRVRRVSRVVRWCLHKQFPGGPWSESN